MRRSCHEDLSEPGLGRERTVLSRWTITNGLNEAKLRIDRSPRHQDSPCVLSHG